MSGDLHDFLIQWNYVPSNMGDEPLSTELLRDVFYPKIEGVTELEYDLNTYERMQESNPRKCCEFLIECVESAFRLKTNEETCWKENSS